MGQKISQLTALSTTYADTDLLEVSVDTGGGTFVTRKMTFLQLRTAFTKLQANLDVNSFQITSASNGNIIIRPNGSGAVLVGGNSSQATELRFMEDSDNGTNYVALKVADALAASTTYTLPSADGTTGQVLSTNGTGTLSWATAAGGLTKFTEAEATTSPNNTVYVDSLTAAGSTTNVDIAIVPKGTGAFLLDIPDSASTGGNKRGAGAVDLQTSRSSAGQVASGANSFAAGKNSTASGDTSIAIGNTSNSSGSYSVALGNSTASNEGAFAAGASTASGQWSTATGYSNTASGTTSVCLGGGGSAATGARAFAVGLGHTASGTSSVCLGQSNVSSASASISLGEGNTASGTYSVSLGYQANTNTITKRLAFGHNANNLWGKFILAIDTTNDTATLLTAEQTASATFNQITLPNNSSYRFKGTIIGKRSGTADVAAWDIDGIIVRGANAAATTLPLSNVTLVQNTPAWGTPTLAANTTTGCLEIKVIGAASTNIRWTCAVETTEVIYA